MTPEQIKQQLTEEFTRNAIAAGIHTTEIQLCIMLKSKHEFWVFYGDNELPVVQGIIESLKKNWKFKLIPASMIKERIHSYITGMLKKFAGQFNIELQFVNALMWMDNDGELHLTLRNKHIDIKEILFEELIT